MMQNENKLVSGFRQAALLLAGGLVVGLGVSIADTVHADRSPPPTTWDANVEIARLGSLVEELQGKLAVNDLKVERLTRITQYSGAYRIPANQAAAIYDAALAEGLHPSLGFQLVKVESGFKPQAQSNMNALGLTQVRIATARELEPEITPRQLLNPDTNLRIGFRVLRRMLRQFDNDLELALRAYNLGPTGALMSYSDTTANAKVAAYADRVMRGVSPKAGGTQGID